MESQQADASFGRCPECGRMIAGQTDEGLCSECASPRPQTTRRQRRLGIAAFVAILILMLLIFAGIALNSAWNSFWG